ncbi:MAG TPA: helix-turn-helix domain-containing protein [Gemmatimonadaceae bacterium]|jgi:hypothetical protein
MTDEKTIQTTKVPVSDAAASLRITRETLIRRIQRGEIHGAKERGYWFVDKASLARALDAEHTQAAAV